MLNCVILRTGNVIGLDVDEVLAQLHKPWLEWGNQRFSGQLHEFYSWEAPEEAWGVKAYEFLRGYIYNSDLVKPYPCALATVNLLRELGFQLRFVTSCPNDTEGPKLNWLIRHGFLKATKEFVPGSDKANAPVDLLVDDYHVNCEKFGWERSVLMTRPHNRAHVPPQDEEEILFCPQRISHIAQLPSLLLSQH